MDINSGTVLVVTTDAVAQGCVLKMVFLAAALLYGSVFVWSIGKGLSTYQLTLILTIFRSPPPCDARMTLVD